MKIMFTGGGSGGHFYPIVAVARALQEQSRALKLLEPELYFAAPSPYDKKILFDTNITYLSVSSGKMRRYFSVLNFFDFFKTGWGIIKALWRVLLIFPDVIFGKGGYGSFPVLFAAKIFRIPVIIHESDSVPGRVNSWAKKFAKKVAISFPEAASHFEESKIALTGNPVRHELLTPQSKGAAEFLKLESKTPTLFVIGGSQGAQMINDTIIEALPRLLKSYQIIHQTGAKNIDLVQKEAELVLQGIPEELRGRYHAFGFLDVLALRMAAGAADVVVSRAGSTIFEIAVWGKPSVIIPITDSHGDHQRKNAFSYARSGACVVIEEENLTPHLLTSEVERLIEHSDIRDEMSKKAREFSKPEAATKIAREILDLALEHEK